MNDAIEIKYNFDKIEDAIEAIQVLQNRAVTCSNMKFMMQKSKGASKTALIDAHDTMADLAASVATMIGGMISDLKYAKTHMKQEDDALARKMTRN